MQSMEFHSRYLDINEGLLNFEFASSYFFSQRWKFPDCSDSSCFVVEFFWSRVDINGWYWSNFCPAALCWGTAGAMGYGQGTAGAPRLQGLCTWLAADPPCPASQAEKSWETCGPVVTRWSHGDKTRPGVQWAVSLWARSRNSDQWDTWSGAGMAITQL